MQLMTMPWGVYKAQLLLGMLVLKVKALTPYVLQRAPPPVEPLPLLMMPTVFTHPDDVAVNVVNGSENVYEQGPPPQ